MVGVFDCIGFCLKFGFYFLLSCGLFVCKIEFFVYLVCYFFSLVFGVVIILMFYLFWFVFCCCVGDVLFFIEGDKCDSDVSG